MVERQGQAEFRMEMNKDKPIHRKYGHINLRNLG